MAWFGGPLYVAIGYGTMMSQYRAFDRAHVIDHEILREEFHLDASHDWAVVIEKLAGKVMRELSWGYQFVGILFALNGVASFMIWRHVRRVKE